MKRREFLSRCASTAVLTATAPPHRVSAKPRAPQYYDAAKLTQVGISSLSFHNYFPATRKRNFHRPGPMMALLDFPQIIADRYQVYHLEIATPHFASTGPEYVIELHRQILRVRSHLVNIMIDVPEMTSGRGLSDPVQSARIAAVEEVKRWVDIARALNALSVRANPGAVNPGDLTPTLDSYREISAYGRRRRIDVLMENREGAEPGNLIDILREAGGRPLGALPDFANFPSETARTSGLEILFPRALTLCHADGISFDAYGDESAFNFPACIQIAKRNQFRGIYSVQYDGPDDPYQGVQHVVNELIRYL